MQGYDAMGRDLTVSELTDLIKTTLESGFYGLRVTGEISNWRPSSTGHWFFSLQDENAIISCVLFRSKAWKVDFVPKNGDKVIVTGHLDVYPKRGSYQIVCDTLVRAGNGEILAMLEERKKAYEAKGYFAPELKKPLPLYPGRVGVVTSPTGAALQDILQILGRRAPFLDVLVLPAVVQGEGAGQTIAQRITEANLFHLCDVLIVGRGGGSIEDLLPFSECCVIEAIHASSIPVVSGVGHEIDWALSDFAADRRAPTPSAAAELVSQGFYDLRQRVASAGDEMSSLMEQKLEDASRLLASARPGHLRQLVESKIETGLYRVDDEAEFLSAAVQRRLEGWQHTLALSSQMISARGPRTRIDLAVKDVEAAKKTLGVAIATRLDTLSSALEAGREKMKALSPLAVMERGYSVVTDKDGHVIRTKADAPVGADITIRLSDGSRKATVRE